MVCLKGNRYAGNIRVMTIYGGNVQVLQKEPVADYDKGAVIPVPTGRVEIVIRNLNCHENVTVEWQR